MAKRGYAGGPVARYLLLGTVVFLTCGGLVMIYSASYAADFVKFGDSAYHLKSQLLWIAAGIVTMLVLARMDYRVLKRIAWPLLGAANVLLLLTLTHGIGKWGAQRWLVLGPTRLQPSEFAKLAVMLVLALLLSDKRKRDLPFTQQAGWVAIVVLPVVALIMMQPDMGTTVAILVASFVLLMLGDVGGRYLAGLIAVGAVAVPAMIALEPYRMARFTSFLDPWKDPKGNGYQIIQALYAFGSGGLRGVGLGMSRQKYFYLPAAHTDFIFAIIGEELGLIGTVAVVAAFVVLAYAGLRIAIGARDRFGKLLAGGLTALIVMQAVMNMAAVTSVMPVTGITLPLVSYGGSSMVFTMGCLGLILSVSQHGTRAEGARTSDTKKEIARADTAQWGRDGRPRLSSIDGGRAPARKRA